MRNQVKFIRILFDWGQKIMAGPGWYIRENDEEDEQWSVSMGSDLWSLSPRIVDIW